MIKEERFGLWLLAAGIPLFFILVGHLVAYSAGGTPNQGLGVGLVFGLFAEGIYIALLLRWTNISDTPSAPDPAPKKVDTAELEKECAERR